MFNDYNAASQAAAVSGGLPDNQISKQPIDSNLGYDARIAQTSQQRISDIMKYSVPGVIGTFMDTVGSSVGLFPEGAVADFVKTNIDPEMGRFMKDNHDGLETVSSMTGMFIPGLAATKLIQGGGFLSRAIAAGSNGYKNKLLSSVFTSGEELGTIVNGVRAKALYAAQRGQTDLSAAALKGLPEVAQAVKNAKTVNFLDSVKRSLAFEAGVAATMNTSDTLFPNDWDISDYLLLGAAGTGVGAFIDHAFLKRGISRAFASVSKEAEAARDVAEIAGSKVLFSPRPLDRSREITLSAIGLEATQSRISQAGVDPQYATNLNREIQETKKFVISQLEKAGKDKLPGILGKGDKEGAVPSLVKTLEHDPTAFLGTYSYEIPEMHKTVIRSYDEKAQSKAKQLAEKAQELFESNAVAQNPEIAKQVQALWDTSKMYERMQFIMARPNGEMLPAQTYSPRAHDLGFKFKKHTTAEGPQYSVKDLKDPQGVNLGYISINEQGIMSFPAPAQPTIGARKPVPFETKFHDVGSYTDAVNIGQEPYYKILRDISDTLNFDAPPGSIGNALKQRLSPEAKNVLSDWTAGGSGQKHLRDLFDKNDPLANEIYRTFDDVRALLHAGNDTGMIKLYRGTSKADLNKFSIASYSTDIITARAFAKGADPIVIEKYVPINDIVAIGPGFRGEREFIVKNANMYDTQSATRIQINNANATIGWDNASNLRKSLGWMGLQQLAEDFASNPRYPIYISDNAHFTQLDFMARVVELNPNAKSMFKFTNGFEQAAYVSGMDVFEFAEMRSLSRKFTTFTNDMNTFEQIASGPLKLDKNELPTIDDIIYNLNLPKGTLGRPNPLVEYFITHHTTSQTPSFGNKKTFLRQLEAITNFPDLTPRNLQMVNLRGNNLSEVRTDKGDFMPSVLLAKETLTQDTFARQAVENHISMRRAALDEALTSAGNSGAAIIQEIVNSVYGTQYLQQAREVRPLINGPQRGAGVFTQQSFATDIFPTMNALHMVDTITGKVGQTKIAEKFDAHSLTFNTMRAKENIADVNSFSLFYHATRFGWDLDPERVKVLDSGIQYYLKDTDKNKALWARFFKDSEMPGDALLPAMTQSTAGTGRYVPLTNTPLAHKSLESFQQLGTDLLNEVNFVRKQLGLNPINWRPWHLPAKNLAKGENAIIVNAANEPIRIVNAKNKNELSSLLEKELRQGEFAVDMANVKKYFENGLGDDVFTKLTDFSDVLAQTGGMRGKTAIFTAEQGINVFDDLVKALQNQYESLIPRTRGLLFESQWNYAKYMSDASGAAGGTERNIWQQYNATIFGNRALTPNTTIGGLYNKVEQLYDNVLAPVYDRVIEQAAKLGAPVSRELAEKVRKESEEFGALKSKLGAYTPFKDVSDYMESTYKVVAPSTMKKHMATLNYIASTVTLRLFDAGQALLNMTSLAATMPAVTTALRRLPGEDIGAWKSRIGAFGSTVADDTAVLNPSRLAVSATNYMFSPEGRTKFQEAAKQGWFKPDVAQLFETIVAPQESLTENKISRLIKGASYLADKSEEWSRGMSWMQGYYLAKTGLKFTNDKDAMIFAMKFANDVVGDYRPLNRPQMFQGAAGMPLGLFQTYMWNYMQRLYSYIENRQLRAVATQYAMQTAVFGLQTVPGWNQFVEHFASAHQGQSNPIDGLRARFGEHGTDLLLYGTISNIPKLFGKDGIALYSRGDANISRIPTLVTPGDSPVVNLASTTYQAAAQALNMFREGGKFSPQQMAEIIGTYSPNRFFRGLAEIGAGYSVDRRGAVITNEVTNGMSIASRLLASKPLSESKQIEAYYRTRAIEVSEQAARERTRDALRSAFRAGSFDEELYADTLRHYIATGGNPASLGQFLRENYVTALMTRNDREFLSALKNPSRLQDVIRLYDAFTPKRGLIEETD